MSSSSQQLLWVWTHGCCNNGGIFKIMASSAPTDQMRDTAAQDKQVTRDLFSPISYS